MTRGKHPGENLFLSVDRNRGRDDRHHHRDHRGREGARPRAGGRRRRHGRHHAARPARSCPTPPSAVDPATLVHAEIVAGRRLHAPRASPRGTHVRADGPRAATPAHTCCRSTPTALGAPQRRRHGQGPVAGLPDARATCSCPTRAACSPRSSGTRPGRHDALFGTSRWPATTERYGDGSAAGAQPRRPRAVRAGRGQARPRAAATCRRASPSSRASGVDDDGRPASRARPARRSDHPARRACRCSLLVANTAAPARPARATSSTPLEVLAWRGAPTAPGDPLWDATPEGRRAFVEHRTTT